jgi:hypothetical protein
MLKRSLHMLLPMLLMTILSCGLVHAVQVDEFELKTAYLYNFVLFTTWPASWPPEMGNTIGVCTIGDDRFGNSIEQLHNRKVRGKRVVVRRAIALEQAPSCHMLYIAESERQNMATIIESLRGSSVLTISEASSANALKEEGGGTPMPAATPPLRCVITLILDNKRLVFEVDSEAAKQAGLTMSSRLLYLARHVY